jgi:SAM-dependent methyltransferase
MNTILKYYGKSGTYLKDHKNYFCDQNLKRDSEFIIQSLKLTKRDKCLDLPCAHGRLTVELKTRGYDVDGLDFSSHMIDLAKKLAKDKKMNIDFFIEDLKNFELPKKYTKVFLFFPDWTDLNFEKVLPNISKIIKRGGLFLYDHDNLFRIWNYLEKNLKEKNKFVFNPTSMTLKEKNNKKSDRYYSYPELENIFRQNGFKVIATYGHWTIEDGKYNYNSPRLRIVAKKI